MNLNSSDRLMFMWAAGRAIVLLVLIQLVTQKYFGVLGNILTYLGLLGPCGILWMYRIGRQMENNPTSKITPTFLAILMATSFMAVVAILFLNWNNPAF